MKGYENEDFAIAIGIFAVVLLAVALAVTVAQVRGASNPQLERRVRRELVTLPYYGVFDNLAYEVNGGTVTLYASGASVDALRR